MIMTLTDKQQALFEFVKFKHGDQKRKYTGQPYYTHLLNVASIVSQYEDDCVEIALCHDLFEDTDCDYKELFKKLISIGYTPRFSCGVYAQVGELTDKYTKETHPHLNREKRKEEECNRLSTITRKAQSVKYADLIDNTKSIVEYDKEFAKTYLKEKEDILKVMIYGNEELFKECKKVLLKAQEELSRT